MIKYLVSLILSPKGQYIAKLCGSIAAGSGFVAAANEAHKFRKTQRPFSKKK